MRKSLGRQRSIDFAFDRRGDDVNKYSIHLRRLISVEETDFKNLKDGDMAGNGKCTRDEREKSVKIKLAAIYNDQKSILKMLKNENSINAVQDLLAMKDERGQPCIFYALESRSRDALDSLLVYVNKAECLVATNGESVLHVVTRMGDVEILRTLLQKSIAVELVDHVENNNGRAPLHLAAKFNHVEIAKELLVHGAKFDRVDVTGETPIFIAASKGHASLLEVFLKHGRDSIDNLILDSDNRLYGKFYDNLLQVAVDSGDEKSVNVCLDQDPQIVRRCLDNEIEHGDGGLIHSTCENGMKNCLSKIVDSMGRLETLHLNRKDKRGFTPIHKAALNNHAHVVKVIASISRSFVNQTTPYSQTTLMLAVQAGHVEVVEELINLKADFRTCDASSRTVLHYAIDNPRILNMLLKIPELAQLLINKKEKDGYTPVHNAALKGLCQSLKILLEKGADINVYTNTSRSPLHCAVSSQCAEVVQLVLSNEPALLNKADATGKTPLHTAASYGNADIVRCLLDAGAIVISDSNLYSPLHNASHKGHLEVVEMLVDFKGKHIMDWGNKYGRTALIEAATTGKTDVVQFLLDNDASITEDHEFFNCLDWCLIKNDKESAMTMMCHPRWEEILGKTRHGTEGTMAKLVYKMPEVAYRVLSNSMTSQGHPDSKEHVKRYDFLCLQNSFEGCREPINLKPMTAIKTMVSTNCYSCLTHPVCCKFLKAKWMEFGWKYHFVSLLMYVTFLLALNVYAFGIPSYKTTSEKEDNGDTRLVELAMVICLIFTSVNTMKEIIQLIFYRHRYFLDTVNYLECVLYVCAFIFAIPIDQKIAVKTSLQWTACSIALLLAWINLVISLRRYASYGIIVLMMKRISITLIKVLSLFIFFFVAFAAAFTPIMNDRQGFANFGQSMLTSAVMTMGEFEYKETFLGKTSEAYQKFYWLRLVLLVVFLVLMPIILMNLLLALAIDDTNKIRQQAKLRKHIQTAEMIIDIERKRSLFPWGIRTRTVPPLEERPNKRVKLLRAMWEYLFYGHDYSIDDGIASARGKNTPSKNVEQTLSAMMDMIKGMQQEMVLLRHNLVEMQHGSTFRAKNNSRKDFRSASTQFRGYSESFQDNSSDENSNARTKRQNDWITSREKFNQHFPQSDSTNTAHNGDVFPQTEDVKDEKEREEQEIDPELIELKELYKKTPEEGCDEVDNTTDDDHDEEIGSRLANLFERIEELPEEDENAVVV